MYEGSKADTSYTPDVVAGARPAAAAAGIHPTADVADTASIGRGTRVWHHAHVREHARIGENCTVGKDAYIDARVIVGDNVKIQNGCYLYAGVEVEDGVFIGPGAILTNDRVPRAINLDGTLKGASDWVLGHILLSRGSSIGAGAVVLPGVTVGHFAMVGCGSVVIRDVPAHALVVGNPARIVGFVCACGARITRGDLDGDDSLSNCAACGAVTRMPAERWEEIASPRGRP